MTTHQHTIQLSRSELATVKNTIRRGKHNTRVITRARILLLSHEGEAKDAIAARLTIGRSTVQRARARYREGGLERALYDAPRSGQPKKITDEDEAHLAAIACSDPPTGHAHWTLELLQQRLKKDRKTDVTIVAIWQRLDQRGIKPWREKNVVHSRGG